MASLPLTDIVGKEGSKVKVEPTPTGFHLQTRKGLQATVRRLSDGLVCRVARGSDADVVQLGVGHTTSRLCNAIYSPSADTAIVFDADGLRIDPVQEKRRRGFAVSCDGPLTVTILQNYLRVHRKLPWFTPLDRSVFPRAPAGWCSWYFYYLAITEDEVVRNTDWLAEHLKPFGCEWVQIDDGWQGRGRGFGSNRDWFVTCAQDFPKGMKFCADHIRSKGFRAGIWCIPFTQSDTALFEKEPSLFLHRDDGTSPGERKEPLNYQWMEEGERKYEWAGRYVIDPTGQAGQAYLRQLFTMICKEWGYDYVKIDAQGGMANWYNEYRKNMADPSLDGHRAYRKGLKAIKAVMGRKRFLLNCGCGFSSVGLCEGIRIGGDVGLSWKGMQPALSSSMEWLYLNTIAFYTDPDVVCVREPLPFDQARVWATFVGITGQLLMASDKMYELPEERVELLRRIFPVADIHPMDLYPLEGASMPGVFDLKIDRPGVGRWDVVGLFNWSESDRKTFKVSPQRLGLDLGAYVYLDVHRGTLVAESDGDVEIEVPPTACRVISVWRATDRPQFVGTSRHLTQGAVDVSAVAWDEAALTLSGVSEVVGRDPYRVRIHVPAGYRVASDGVETYGRLAILTLRSEQSVPVSWSVRFERT